jgi:hypothetical protein
VTNYAPGFEPYAPGFEPETVPGPAGWASAEEILLGSRSAEDILLGPSASGPAGWALSQLPSPVPPAQERPFPYGMWDEAKRLASLPLTTFLGELAAGSTPRAHCARSAPTGARSTFAGH